MEFKIQHKIEPGYRLKVCAYARISNDKEVLESSLEEQIDAYTTIILDHPMWEFSGIYVDKGISGTTINERKQFLKMINDAESGIIDVILVKSISRFGRNIIDLLTVIRRLRKINVEVFFEQQNMSSLDLACDQMITMYAEFAEEEAKSVSQNVSWTYKRNRAVGKYYLPAKQMLGFDFDEKGEVIIDKEEAVYINKIYDMFIDGHSIPEICHMMEKSGISTVTGVPWNSPTIRSILKNEKYCGDCLLQKEYIQDFKTHKKVNNCGERSMVYVQNGHPAVVTREKWEAAQRRFEANKQRYGKGNKTDGTYNSNNTSPFTGFFYCPYCGRNYHIKTRKHNESATAKCRERKFIICSTNVKKKACKNEAIFLEPVIEAIKSELDILRNNMTPLKQFIIEGLTQCDEGNIENEIMILDSKIETLRNKYEALRNKYDEFSVALKERVKTEIHDLVKEKTRKQTEILSSQSAAFRASTIIKELKKLPSSIEDLEHIDFRAIFSRAIVKDRKTLVFVIGNEDVSNVKVSPNLAFKGLISYKVRATMNYLEFGLVIAK